ncbi:MAG: class I SAM-dependent methyltransferase [Solirubrobacterales bacterium]|nr:class I SAM-dependent methyltransferase [Solirubrobacterales bacterium]
MLAASLRKLRMPPDTFERHSLIATLGGEPQTVLDVGGIQGELGLFLPDAEITTINMAGERADLVFDGDTLPFPDRSFDLAVSLDVLEHIPGPERARHFAELARVASSKVIICCPLGGADHVAAEQALADWYLETTGEDHRFLREHLAIGLPTEDELGRLAAGLGLPYRIRFHGDFRRANRAFEASTMLRARPGPRSGVNYARVRFDPRRSLRLDAESHGHTNRAFVELDPGAGPAGP